MSIVRPHADGLGQPIAVRSHISSWTHKATAGQAYAPQSGKSAFVDALTATSPFEFACVCGVSVGLRLARKTPASGRSRSCHGDRVCRQGLNAPWVPSTSNVRDILKMVQWPDDWPYVEEDFKRSDQSDDALFYAEPRFCTHADDGFITALRSHYGAVFEAYPEARILDICSSWVSHYPQEKSWSHVSITGLNEEELKKNEQADDYYVADLNMDPRLRYESESFDVVTCALSFDYLTKALDVMKEVARVLKPGGMVILSTSTRCFPSKAIDMWLRTNPLEHVLIYGSYIHYSGEFEPPEAMDLSPVEVRGMGWGDPTYVIQARKKGGRRYLPTTLNGVLVLSDEGGNIFRADKSNHQTESQGLAYRFSKRMEDKDENMILRWGDTVRVVEQSGGWAEVEPIAKEATPARDDVAVAECVPGLKDWLVSRRLERHFDAANDWCAEMGASDFTEVAENAHEFADFLGPALTQEERVRLLRGTHM